MTCSEKRDHLGYFIKIEIEFLAWIDSSVCTESNSANVVKNIDHKWSYDQFYTRRYIIFDFWKMYKVVYVSEQLFAPIMIVYIILQLHKHSISI